jgi:putative FmdB family regulatory protein
VPIYEYLCQACSHRFEVKQSIKDDPIKSCARCGSAVSKLISSPAIMFKGSGWYVTDYSDKLKPTDGNGEAEKKTTDKPAEGTPQPAAAAESTTPSAPVAAKETSAAPAAASPSSGTAAPTPTTSSS